jgi:hypothetical protein
MMAQTTSTARLVSSVLLVILTIGVIILIIIESKRYSLLKESKKEIKSKNEKVETEEKREATWNTFEPKLRPAPLLSELLLPPNQIPPTKLIDIKTTQEEAIVVGDQVQPQSDPHKADKVPDSLIPKKLAQIEKSEESISQSPTVSKQISLPENQIPIQKDETEQPQNSEKIWTEPSNTIDSTIQEKDPSQSEESPAIEMPKEPLEETKKIDMEPKIKPPEINMPMTTTTEEQEIIDSDQNESFSETQEIGPPSQAYSPPPVPPPLPPKTIEKDSKQLKKAGQPSLEDQIKGISLKKSDKKANDPPTNAADQNSDLKQHALLNLRRDEEGDEETESAWS